jgi:hypothetical protein
MKKIQLTVNIGMWKIQLTVKIRMWKIQLTVNWIVKNSVNSKLDSEKFS